MTRYFATALSVFILSSPAYAQNAFRVVARDKKDRQAMPGVAVGDKYGHGAMTNDSGVAVITGIPNGPAVIYFSFTGYNTDSLTVTMPDNTPHEKALIANEKALEEVIVVSATRTNERIENAPTKVEVLGNEDLQEENTIRPANIASILSDVSGIQLQQSSAISGNTNVRVQGLNGQYTQILRDGMPLYDGFSGGFGVLQVPPLDLKQVELIKGSASTLYGGGAIGGLINLVSRKPTTQQEGVLTVNATTLNEQDVNAYVAKRFRKIGYTLFAGYIHQSATDVNNDGFSDVPNLNSVTLHPRLLFYPNDKTTLTIGYNGTFENRMGGDMQVINNLADSAHRYYERNVTRRNTGEVIFERSLPQTMKLTIKGSASSFNRDIVTNIDDIKGNQLNYYAEASIFIPRKLNSLVAGVNAVGDHFKILPASDPVALNGVNNDAAGAFAQYTLHIHANTTLEGGIRADHTFQYGDFLLPRLTGFHRFNETWAVRAGAGMGYKTPNPLEVQIIDYPLNELQPLPTSIKAERSTGYNLEGNFKKDLGDDMTLFINHAFFLTRITDAVIATQAVSGQVYFSNANKEVTTMGFDSYARLSIGSLELYAGYTYTDAERTYLAGNQFMPLTPRNRAAFTAVKKLKEKWRIGLEGSYIGVEYRDGDVNTKPYFLTALMIERKFGKLFTVVLNGENLLDYRQSKVETLYTGSTLDPTFKPLWAPIDGRVINLSVRITPFNK